jgi:hypothetical protein
LEVMERDATIALCYPQAIRVDADGRNPQYYDDVLHLVQEDPADRFVALLDKIKLAHQHLGLIRMAHLRKTHLLGAYVGSDINLLAELSLYGKFFELPDRVFFRRFHKDSGSWKRGDVEHEVRRYHASGAKNIGLNKWHRHLGFFPAVLRSPLPLNSKVRLYRYLLRRMIWDRRDLSAELSAYVRTALSSRPAAFR